MTPRAHAYIVEAAQRHYVEPADILSKSKRHDVVAATREVVRRLAADGYSQSRIGCQINRCQQSVSELLRRSA